MPDRPDDFADAAEPDETAPGSDPGAAYEEAVAAGEVTPPDDGGYDEDEAFPDVGDVFRSGS